MAKQIFLFYGEEDYLIQQRVNQIKASVNNPELNIEQIEADEASFALVSNALQTPSLFALDRLLIIKNLDLKLEIWARLVGPLENLSPGTRVIIWTGSVSKKAKLFKCLDKIAEVYEFRSFADWQQDKIVFWLVDKVRSLGKEIDFETATEFQEICGTNLRSLDSEIEKLVTFVGAQKNITKSDVLKLASPGEKSVFALSDALLRKSLPEALTAFEILFRNKVDLFQLLGLLATNFRTLLQIKSFSGGHKDNSSIAQAIGANPYFVKKCLAKVKNFNEAELKNCLQELLQTDLKLKSGHSPLVTFELLLTSLCQ